MSLVEYILTRRSFRRHKKKDIPEYVLAHILESGRQGLSAVNKQPIRFIVVKNSEIKKGLSSYLFNRSIARASVHSAT